MRRSLSPRSKEQPVSWSFLQWNLDYDKLLFLERNRAGRFLEGFGQAPFEAVWSGQRCVQEITGRYRVSLFTVGDALRRALRRWCCWWRARPQGRKRTRRATAGAVFARGEAVYCPSRVASSCSRSCNSRSTVGRRRSAFSLSPPRKAFSKGHTAAKQGVAPMLLDEPLSLWASC